MIIEECRTNDFKEVIKMIASDVCKGLDYDVISNMGINKKPKTITINKVKYDDCVAYCKYTERNDKYIQTNYKPILYFDYIKFNRNIKLAKLNGIKSPIVKKKNVVVPKFDLVVGQYYCLGSNMLIKIIGKTAKRYKYKKVYYRLPNEIQKQKHDAMEKQFGYDATIKISDIVYINDDYYTENCEGVLKLNKYGEWFDGGYYNSRIIYSVDEFDVSVSCS